MSRLDFDKKYFFQLFSSLFLMIDYKMLQPKSLYWVLDGHKA